MVDWDIKIDPLDICELDNARSLTRQVFVRNGAINTKDYQVDLWTPPARYTIKKINLHDDSPGHIYEYIEPIRQELKTKKFASKLHTGVYEAITNAHSHAHKKNPDKTITLAYLINNQVADAYIADEGGSEIDPNMIPFLLVKKKPEFRRRIIPFYDFAEITDYNCDEHSGNGINTMHLVADTVKYYVNKNGGLVVNLRLEKPAANQIPFPFKP